MSLGEGAKKRSWVIPWIIGILLTSAAFYILLRAVRWDEVKLALTSVSVGTIFLAWLLYFISMIARAWAWQTLLQRKITLLQAVLGLNEGYFLNNILPFRLGELGRAVLTGRKSGLGTLRVLPTVVVERAYDLVFAASLLLVSLPLILKMEWARQLAILLLVILLGSLVGLYFASRHRQRLLIYLEKRFGHLNLVERYLLRWLHSLLDGFSVLNRLEFFLVSLAALALSWFLAIIECWIVIQALVPGAPFWWALLAISVASLGGALPSMAASLGTFEGAATGALVLAGNTPEMGLVYALVIHMVHLVSSSILGGLAITTEGKNLAGVIADLRSAQEKS